MIMTFPLASLGLVPSSDNPVEEGLVHLPFAL